MNRSELVSVLADSLPHLRWQDVDLAVRAMLEHMSQTLSSGDRIEIRGFGSFSLNHHPSRIGRNPKTGESIAISERYVPHFKPGKDLRERVNT